MIKENELRIGNIVNTEYGILSVHASMLVDIVNNGFNVDPIPITPEILLKCNYIEKQKNNYSKIYFFVKNKKKHEMLYWTKYPEPYFYVEINQHRKKITSLHQLQNSHFDLLGEQLTINL